MASAAACGAVSSLDGSPGYDKLDAACSLYAEEWHRGLLDEGGVHPLTAVKAAVYMAQQAYSQTNVRLWTAALLGKLAAALQSALDIDELQALAIVAAVEAVCKAPGGAQPDGGRVSSTAIAIQPSGPAKKSRKKETPVEANVSEQKRQVRAIADKLFFSITPRPAKTAMFSDLTKDLTFKQDVEAAMDAGHAVAQAIADRLPGSKCRWPKSAVRTKLRQRFDYLKDPAKAIAKELERREKKREGSQSGSRAGGTPTGAATGSNGTGSETAVALEEPAHSDVPAALAIGSGRASCSPDSQPAPGAATEAAAPANQAQARGPTTRRRTRADMVVLMGAGTETGGAAEGAEAAAAAGSRRKRGQPAVAPAASPGGRRAGQKRARSSAARPGGEDAGKSQEEADAATMAQLFAGVACS